MKAWNVHQKYGDATAIVFAETAGKSAIIVHTKTALTDAIPAMLRTSLKKSPTPAP